MKYKEIFDAYVETADEFLKRRAGKNLSTVERDEMIAHAFGKLNKEEHNIQSYKYFLSKYCSEDDSIHTRLSKLSKIIGWIESHRSEINNDNIDYYYSKYIDKI